MVEKTLGDVATYINGRAFKPQEWETSGRPIIRIQNLTNSTQECNRTTKQFEEKYRISDGDLLFAWSASLGAHIWHGEDGWLNQHIFKVIPNESIDKIYLYYYLLYVVDQLYAKTHGSGMVHITLKPFKSTRIMLPELNEQRRVVGKIESLFAKLDEAKEKAQAVVDSFETRKAAILHKAFTGELTAKWREEHGVGMESWEKKSVDELCGSLKYGTAKKSNASGSVVVLRMGNLQQGEIDWSDLAYSNDPDDIEKYKLFPGDVLFNRTNSAALVGKTAIYRGEHPAIYAGYLIKLDYDHDKIIGDCLDDWERQKGYEIISDGNVACIAAYEASTLFILNKLLELSQLPNKGQKEVNERYLRDCNIAFSDPKKEETLKYAFVNSRVLLIYGAAGTGKTTLIDMISTMLSGRRKLFLTKTHTALQNLQRRINNPGADASFVSINSFTKRVNLPDYDVIFVDECSTIDNRAMKVFLEKMRPDTFLVLAGDTYQIESIDFGNWFTYAKDIIKTKGSNVR